MDYNAAEIQAAFEHGGNTPGYKCRTYSTAEMEIVRFSVPSSLISIKYDCWEKCFYIKFEKFHSSWGDYVTAITRSVHYIMSALKAGGLDVSCPAYPDELEIRASSGDKGMTKITWAEK